MGAPVTDRTIPLAIFQADPATRVHFLKKWTKQSNIMEDVNIRDVDFVVILMTFIV